MKRVFVEILDYVKIILIALIITNILNVFVFSLSPWFEPYKIDPKINLHLSYEINKKAQWEEIFNNFEFTGPLSEQHDSGYHYIFNHRYRGKVREEEGSMHTFWSTLKKKK